MLKQIAGGSAEGASATLEGAIVEDLAEEPGLEDMAEQMQVPGNCAAGSVMLYFLKKKTLKPSANRTRA